MSELEPLLQARGLVKRYGHVVALAGADLELYPGEILAVIGDNGAGKSTLIKALSGALQPDEGEIRLAGEPVHFRSPGDARRAGIETVYQDLAVAPSLDIAANIFLGREQRRRGPLGFLLRMMDKRAMRKKATRHFGLQIVSYYIVPPRKKFIVNNRGYTLGLIFWPISGLVCYL